MKNSKLRPPSFCLRFFRWYCHRDLRDHIEGDLRQLYSERFHASGKTYADLLFMIDVLLLFRPAIIRPFTLSKNLNKNIMIGNYVKVSWRNLKREKGYSIINIGGLGLGMAVAIILGLWTFDELSFNKSFKNYDRLGHVWVHNGEGTYPSNPVPLAAELKASFGDDFEAVSVFTWMHKYPVTFGDKKFFEPAVFIQPEGADMLSLEMLKGTRSALNSPQSVLISSTLAQKLFGDGDPINKSVRLKNLIDVNIGGVYKDLPFNSDFRDLSIIGSWDFLVSWMTWMKEQEERWDDNSNKIFVQLRPGVDFASVSAKIKDLKLPHLDEENRQARPELFIHPMSEWHLNSKFENRKAVMSEQMEYILFYGVIGVFVLILACINFTNLSTARSERRAKEVGIRKSMGSFRTQLITQFFTESLLNVSIALFLSLLIVQLALPWFNRVAGKQIFVPWQNVYFWIASIGFTFLTGLLAGAYPALYLSSFKPIKVLKGTFRSARGVYAPRKVLVVIQFSISVALIIGTIAVSKQIKFGMGRSAGYERAGLVSVYMITPDLFRNNAAIKNELLNSGVASSVAISAAPITEVWSNNSGFEWKGKNPAVESNFVTNQVSADYGKTLEWRFLAGRDFSDRLASDSSSIIINSSAVQYMGLKDPVGEIVKWNDESFQIIGVVDDIIMGSPFAKVEPSIFLLKSDNVYTINIRLAKHISQPDAIAGMAKIFQKYNPTVPFEYNFIDVQYESKFESEMRIGDLVGVFTGLAIAISGLGLYGLASYTAEQRKKELGIRKVIGASIGNLWSLLSKEFVVLVIISCVISFPLTFYLLHRWLQRYDYHTEISWWMFPLAGVGTVLLTLMIVSHQAIKAALANPIQSLKSE